MTDNIHEDELTLQQKILANTRRILEGMTLMTKEMDDLKNEVAQTKTVMGSAIVLLNGLKTSLDAAIANNDMTAVEAIAKDLSDNTDALAAAVRDNTPAVEPPA